MVKSQLRVVKWGEEYEAEGLMLLRNYAETSMFLLNNLEECGPTLGESFNSGNIKCLLHENGQVAAVFSLTKMGNILAQTDRKADYSSQILDACLEEHIPIVGCVAAWDVAELVWDKFTKRFPGVKTEVYSREVLYSLDINSVVKNSSARVRFLTERDYPVWNTMNTNYFIELNFPAQGDDAQRRKAFLEKVKQRYWWGLFIEDELISICSYNAKVGGVAQIGGVYTLPAQRRRGFCTQLMQQVMSDSKYIHNIEKLMLFTEEMNVAARKVYESIGFTHIGYFGLIFGGNKDA